MENVTTHKLCLTDAEMEEAEKYFQGPTCTQPTKKTNELLLIQKSNIKTAIIEEKFDKYLLQSIEEGLIALGEPVKNTVFQYLEFEFDIKKTEIPKKIKEFSGIIHRIIGLGATRVEALFIKQLTGKLETDIQITIPGWTFSKEDDNEMCFADYIHKLRKEYLNIVEAKQQ
jgi:hypothetical protein